MNDERWDDLTIKLQQLHLEHEAQWSELMCAVALAATMQDTRNQIDMLSHAGDLEYDLSGSADHCGRLLEQLDPNDTADAARGKARLTALVQVLREDREHLAVVNRARVPSDVPGFHVEKGSEDGETDS